jgi:hypothetical protein
MRHSLITDTPNERPPLLWKTWLLFAVAIFALSQASRSNATDVPDVQARKLMEFGTTLATNTRYLEALDLLEEARDILDQSGATHSELYADTLFALAQTKIKARIHQEFPASYVKSALEDVQTANRVRENLPKVLPQKLAEGYFLEGYIQKKFFMRNPQAEAAFERTIKVDPGHAAAKRELSELVPAAKRQ